MIRAEYFMNDAKMFHSPNLIRNPAVSIVLPTFCRGDNGLLKRAIDSVLAQRFSSFELIVMDDGSTDSTAGIVSEYVKQDDRVIHVRHENNCGLPALRVNEGLLLARGEFCAYQFDDDQWTDGCLATLFGCLRDNPSVSVVYGRCDYRLDRQTVTLGGPFNYFLLVAGNSIANNSVMHRRSVFEQLGGYDMHLLMRRLCDWDLWLRWARQAQFLFIDELVSIVEGGLTESIGKSVPLDIFVCRAHMGANRNENLRPDMLRAYILDGLEHLSHLGEQKLDAVWREHIAPFHCRYRPGAPSRHPKSNRPTGVLVTKAHFDTTVDITIGNFVEVLTDDFAFTFVPQSQVDENAIRCADILLLHRTIDQHAEQLAEIAKRLGKPVIFLMDDDLTSLHELGAEFSYLAPGEPCRVSLESLIESSDLVVTYSKVMQNSVRDLNTRQVLLETNIRQRWLTKAKSRLKDVAAFSTTSQRPVRIGFAGGGARRQELTLLWPAIVEASRRLGSQAEFLFWGFTPDGLEQLQSPFSCEPFTFSYESYLSRLTSNTFDVLIAPLSTEKRAKRAKCPIKFLEATAAGAVGVYSDVEPYQTVVDGVNGIKCENTIEAWTKAILRAATLVPEERMTILANALQTVEHLYTSERQASRMAATLRAGVLHGILRRGPSGRPRIAYFCHSAHLAGGENNLLRHAEMTQEFQFEPVFVLPSPLRGTFEEIQRRATELGIALAYLPLIVETEADASRQLDESAIAEIEAWLRQSRIALAHSVTLMREVGEAAQRLGIPHVASLYATSSQAPAGFRHCDVIHSDSFFFGNRWGEVLRTSVRRIMSYVPDRYFELGDETGKVAGRPAGREMVIGMFGSIQPRKGQLQAVEAVGLLKTQSNRSVRLRLFGYDHFYPVYLGACREAVQRYGISDLVSFSSFVPDHAAALRDVDVVLCASDWESLPLTVLEAMAAGRLVIAPNVGGIPEVVSRRTGILVPDNTARTLCRAFAETLDLTDGEWRDRTRLAREVVRGECSRYVVAAELFKLYHQAASGHSRGEKGTAFRPTFAASTVNAGVFDALEGIRASLGEINSELRPVLKGTR
ncbi:MAG: glycosyltransferase [Acidobacteriia bacterium]|nr:glycosyltransferase [Terriglobia bacterium]